MRMWRQEKTAFFVTLLFSPLLVFLYSSRQNNWSSGQVPILFLPLDNRFSNGCWRQGLWRYIKSLQSRNMVKKVAKLIQKKKIRINLCKISNFAILSSLFARNCMACIPVAWKVPLRLQHRQAPKNHIYTVMCIYMLHVIHILSFLKKNGAFWKTHPKTEI